jgi:hypothetical protein
LGAPNPNIPNGWRAATALVELMDGVRGRLPPETIIDADVPAEGPKTRARRLWEIDEIREATIQSLAESSVLLARLWASAWAVGGGDSLHAADIRTFTEPELEDLYRQQDFARALSLQQMAESGTFEPS